MRLGQAPPSLRGLPPREGLQSVQDSYTRIRPPSHSPKAVCHWTMGTMCPSLNQPRGWETEVSPTLSTDLRRKGFAKGSRSAGVRGREVGGRQGWIKGPSRCSSGSENSGCGLYEALGRDEHRRVVMRGGWQQWPRVSPGRPGWWLVNGEEPGRSGDVSLHGGPLRHPGCFTSTRH